MVPVSVDDQLYRVQLTVQEFRQAGGTGELLHALDSARIDGAVTAEPAAGRFVTVAQLLEGARRQDGTGFEP